MLQLLMDLLSVGLFASLSSHTDVIMDHLSLFQCRVINEEALEQSLSAAVTCTILAAAGPQRSRVLATLYKVKFSLADY